MKFDREVNEQFEEENQMQESGAKKGTSNAKSYTSRCTSLGLHKMFTALPEEEKGALRTTCFAPLLLIDPITTMLTLVMKIFDRHLGDMKLRRFPKKKNTNGLKEIDDALKQAKLERHHAHAIEAPVIEPPAVSAPVVGTPTIGSSSSATEIGAVVVRVCSQLEEHGKMLLKLDDHGKILHNHGKMLERISMSTVGGSTLPLGDTPLLGQYQFSTPENTVKRKRKRGKGEWQKKSNANKKNKKAEEADVPLKKKVEGMKKEAFIDEQLDHQVASGEGLEVVYDLMVDNDVEVNLEAISSEYGDGLLKWKKGDEKDNDDKKDAKENVKYEEEQPQVAEEEDSEPPTVVVYYNGKKDVQHANEIMVVAEVAKIDIIFFNQEEVVDFSFSSFASADQTTAISTEEQTLEIEKTEDEASQASADQRTAVFVKEQTIEVAQTEVVISHQEEDVGEASQSIYLRSKESKEKVEQNKEEVVEGKDDVDGNSQNKPDPEQVIDVYIKSLIQYFDTQHRARPERERIVLTNVFASQYIGRAFNV
ncbi:hypothetical protein GIB67_016700 [Kingdonia uniflora]|uniref:Uncharacterized protein n=1 Tax=Kingdonia uniflora TaxID=39325 RepID=A0A7J7LMI7_9MAGN|nr:hypothetical protein GIB67_016700 [Kingdonia uniflora]